MKGRIIVNQKNLDNPEEQTRAVLADFIFRKVNLIYNIINKNMPNQILVCIEITIS